MMACLLPVLGFSQIKITGKQMAPPANFAGMNDAGVFASDPSNRLSKWPLFQSAAFTVDGRIKNFGALKNDSVLVNVEIMDALANVVFTGSQTVYNIDSALTANFSVGSYTASTLGLHTIKTYCTLLGIADDDISNDTLYSYFTVTDSTFSRDYADVSGITNKSTFNSAAGSETVMGMTYSLNQPDMLTAIEFTLDKPKNVGDSLYAVVYTVNATGFPDTLIATTVVHFLDSTDVNSVKNYRLQMANGPLQLPAGKFFIGIREIKNINVAATPRIFTTYTVFNRNLNYSPIWKRNEEFSEFFVYVLHPEFGCTLQVTDSTTTETCASANAMAQVFINGASGAYTYLWSNGNTTDMISNITGGTYTVTVTDAAGCVIYKTVTVNADPIPVIDSAASVNANCNATTTGSAQIFVNSGILPYTFLWTGNTTSTSDTANNLAAGNYSVLVTDANGCSVTQNFVINEPAAITSIITTSPDNGNNTGIAFAVVSGGTTPYSYFWSNGNTTATATGLAAGTYILVVTDANGCVYSTNVVVSSVSAIPDDVNVVSLQMYPNPVISNLSIKAQLHTASTVTFHVFDVTGKIIYTYLSEVTKEVNHQINTATWAAGNYMVQMVTDSGVSLQRIVKK
ncbi:MAG: T9SS type A sorting domain-containing protein [Bacteroidia bacterium]|nr:T9SS type A sorting domain-containing protein [Bacteroidia bacterium]